MISQPAGKCKTASKSTFEMQATRQPASVTTEQTAINALPSHGVWAPPLTPVTTGMKPDDKRWLTHLHWLLEHGCHGLALFGTTSEANSFNLDERMTLLEKALATGIEPERLMVGTGCCAVTDTVRLTRHALEHGCKKVLMLPPFYYKGVSDQGLYDSYAYLIEQIDDPRLRIILYHFPKMSATPISVDLVGRLVGSFGEVIAGLKDSSGDWSNTVALLGRFPRMAIFPGTETMLLDGLRAGGAGCISATANANPTAIRAVFDAWMGQDDTLEERQSFINGSRAILQERPAIPAIKYVISHYRADPDWLAVRPPLVSFDETSGQALIKELSEQGYVFPGSASV